jgi:hypothetical protein
VIFDRGHLLLLVLLLLRPQTLSIDSYLLDSCLLLTIHLLTDDSLISLLIQLLVNEWLCLPNLTPTHFDIIDPSFIVYFVLKIFIDYLLILVKIAPPYTAFNFSLILL